MIDADAVPCLTHAGALCREGFVTGASHRNWSAYGAEVDLPPDFPDWRRHLLTDPQTSGGLLAACAAGRAESTLARIRAAGFPAAGIVGRVEDGPAGVRVAA